MQKKNPKNTEQQQPQSPKECQHDTDLFGLLFNRTINIVLDKSNHQPKK